MSSVNKKCFEDAFNMLCGRLMSSGSTRHVYEFALDPDRYVVKVENENPRHAYQNVIESMVWDLARDKNVEKWFAPVKLLSPEGRVLIQRRTTPARDSELPNKLPGFLSDFKPENYGMLDGKFVCHDYGLVWALGLSLATKRTQSVVWKRRPGPLPGNKTE